MADVGALGGATESPWRSPVFSQVIFLVSQPLHCPSESTPGKRLDLEYACIQSGGC